jgi:hypothetical protein
MNAQRLALLRAALGFLQLPPRAPELALVHQWLDNWHGVGLLAVGLHRIGYDPNLRQYGDGHWRATFYVTCIAHSILGGLPGRLRCGGPYNSRGGVRWRTPSALCDDGSR